MEPLRQVFPPADYPEVLIGLNGIDDAAVYDLGNGKALVFTADFFTPVVDTAYEYGAIAAANSLSDVYAMGGKPVLAINLAAFPADMPVDIAQQILLGAAEKAKEAGVVIGGGHTIDDKEPKYGLAVIGLVDPAKLLTKWGAQVGDKLVLTKPLGTGLIATVGKHGAAVAEHMQEAIKTMLRLNSVASNAAVEAGAKVATDITGFGLLGHALEMARGSEVGFKFYLSKIPFLPGSHEYASEWLFPGGAHDNYNYCLPHINFADDIPEETRVLLASPETSGGLLIACSDHVLGNLTGLLEESSEPYWIIGEVVEGEGLVVAE